MIAVIAFGITWLFDTDVPAPGRRFATGVLAGYQARIAGS